MHQLCRLYERNYQPQRSVLVEYHRPVPIFQNFLGFAEMCAYSLALEMRRFSRQMETIRQRFLQQWAGPLIGITSTEYILKRFTLAQETQLSVGPHQIDGCQRLGSMVIAQTFQVLRCPNFCFNCLRPGRLSKESTGDALLQDVLPHPVSGIVSLVSYSDRTVQRVLSDLGLHCSERNFFILFDPLCIIAFGDCVIKHYWQLW